MDAGLHGDDQVAVRRRHDDGQNPRQCQTRQAHRQDLNGQSRDYRVRRAVLGQLFRRHQLMCHHAHEPHQRNGKAVGQRPQKQPLLGCFLALGSEGPLPHFRSRQGKDEIGNDIAHDATIQIGLCQFRSKSLQKDGQATQLNQRCRGDQNVDKQDQHDKLEYIRIDHAEQAGGGRIDYKHDTGDECAHLVGKSDLIAQHIDDGGGGRHLRGHSAHHGKGDQAA